MSHRGPYKPSTDHSAGRRGRPSDALAENVRAYRLLRDMTQDELAGRMEHLCHGWTRSTVGAVETRGRNVTVDELLGLAVSIGVTIGQLLDPTGPDHSRRLSLDVGLAVADGGRSEPIPSRLAHLWVSSRAVVRLWRDGGRQIEFAIAQELPTEVQRELDGLRPEDEAPA